MSMNKIASKLQIFVPSSKHKHILQCFLTFSYTSKVRFASFLSGGFTTMAVINQLEKKMAKRTAVITNIAGI